MLRRVSTQRHQAERNLFLLCALALCATAVVASDTRRGHKQPLGSHADPLPAIAEEQGFLPGPEFYEKYVKTHTPVVFRGANKHWRALTRWKNDSYLEQRAGDLEVFVEDKKKENREGPTFTFPLKKFLDNYRKPEYKDSWYIVQSKLPELLRDDFWLPNALYCESMFDTLERVVMWFSSGGTSSVMHTDSVENILNQVDGYKRLILMSPEEAYNLHADEARIPGTAPSDVDSVDLDKYPRYAKTKFHTVELHPGDALYIPKFWWHQVRSFERNIAINFWWSQWNDTVLPKDDPVLSTHYRRHENWVKDSTDAEKGPLRCHLDNLIRRANIDPVSQDPCEDATKYNIASVFAQHRQVKFKRLVSTDDESEEEEVVEEDVAQVPRNGQSLMSSDEEESASEDDTIVHDDDANVSFNLADLSDAE